MAKPQPEHFLRLSLELLDALARIRIPGESRQCLDFIMRKTWGYQKHDDNISLSQFEKGTGLPRPTAARAIKKLVDMNLVIKNDNTYVTNYKIQKDYDLWKPLTKKITVRVLTKKITGVDNNDNKTVDNNDNKTVDNNVTHNRYIDNIDNNTIDRKNRGKNQLVPVGSEMAVTHPEFKDIVEITISEAEKMVIIHLNLVTGKNYQFKESHFKFIRARFREGHTLADFIYVNFVKAEQWLGTPRDSYLRPKTLYNSENFDGYRQEKPKSKLKSETKTKSSDAFDEALNNILNKTNKRK